MFGMHYRLYCIFFTSSQCWDYHHHHTHTRLTASFPGQSGQAGTRTVKPHYLKKVVRQATVGVAPVLTDLEVACKATLSFKNILRPLFRACLDRFREDYKATPMATLESSLWLLWRRPLALSTKNI